MCVAPIFRFLVLGAAPLANANDVLEHVAPQGQKVQSLFDESVSTALHEAFTIIFTFVLVAVVARSVGISGTVVLRSKQPKATKSLQTSTKVDEETRQASPTAASPRRRNETFRSASPSLCNDRLATVANSLAGAVNAGKATKLPQLLDAAMSRLTTKDEDPETVRTYAAQLLLSSVRACAAKRCFCEGIAAFDHMEGRIGEGCSTTWSLLLWAAVEAGCCDRGILFAKNLRASGEFSQNDVVNLVRCVVHHRDLKQFVEILEDCTSAGVKFEVLTRNRILGVLTSSHAMEFAAEFVARTSDVPLDVIAFNTLMKGYSLAEKPRLCIQLYEQMRNADLAPSDVTFGILLDACVGGSMFDEARRVFDDLKESKIVANVVHYTTYIKGLVSAGCLSDARDVLAEMHESPKTQPDVITYSTLAKAYADIGNVDDGILLLKMMRSQGVEPDVILFNIILSACSVKPVAGHKILEVFKQIVSFGFQPTSSTYSVLIKACSKSGCWELALDFVGSAPSQFNVWPETRIYTQLGQACASAGASSEVMLTYSLLVQACRSRGAVVDAATNMRFIRFCTSNGISADFIPRA